MGDLQIFNMKMKIQLKIIKLKVQKKIKNLKNLMNFKKAYKLWIAYFNLMKLCKSIF